MGIKWLWIGLTIIMAGQFLPLGVPFMTAAGAIIMIIGCILLVLDK